MLMTLVQSEVEKAVRDYIHTIMILQENVDIAISFASTRGEEGLKAMIDITPVTEEPTGKVKETPVVLTREPEAVVETAPQIPEKAMRKPRTLTVEQKPAETVSAAPVEEVATTAQEAVTEAITEQQAASGDESSHDDKVDAVAGSAGFPGFESEEGVSEKAEATTAEPVRKSLFGGLARPSNH